MKTNHMQLQRSRSKLLLRHGFARIGAVRDPVESWRALNAQHAAVQTALELELRREHDLSAVEYEVLDRICGCATGKARMQELADAVHLSQSTCSRVVARLEDEGLALRAMCPDDRRGIFACVTDAGRERVSAAAPTYRRVVTEALGA
jgi:DNA-binding MarR family transcriptional regulator